MSWDFVVNKVFQMVGLKTVHQHLSLPIQESDTNGREHISLGNIPDRRKTEATDRTASPSVTNTARNTGGSNGSKFSKFQYPYTGSPNVFCVKFECCNNFWPCHRCHNDQTSSRDTKMVKGMYYDKVQQFGQFCWDYVATFVEYCCKVCKHLTGKDDHPYHCEKCGNCRVHGDRSFHCDGFGVCLDVQLRGNHKRREGSAHDECCISLEDAFTGCQILPFSHWVHKDCATQIMVRCPICHESFAHIREGQQLPNSRKCTG